MNTKIHPLAVMAIIGLLILSIGGILKVIPSIEDTLMVIGGAITGVAALLSLGEM